MPTKSPSSRKYRQRVSILESQESARGVVEIAKKFFPDVECKWGEAGLNDIIQDASIIGVAIVLAGQTQVDMSLSLLKGGKHVLQAGAELERAISAYSSFNPAPIWAVAENYRFEPAYIEVRTTIKLLPADNKRSSKLFGASVAKNELQQGLGRW